MSEVNQIRLHFDVSTAALVRPVRLHARTAVLDLTLELSRLFGREAVMLEAEA